MPPGPRFGKIFAPYRKETDVPAPRALFLFSCCFFFSAPSLANELDRPGEMTNHNFLRDGGQDGGHTGGGGTFLVCVDERTKKTFYSFWDLRSGCPKRQTEQRGDVIRLKKAWTPEQLDRWEEVGEWIDVRKLKAYRHMLAKLRNWEYWAPNLNALMKESLKRPLRVLATPYYIAPLSELQVAYGYENVQVVPGAFFQYERERLYLNLEVFNAAGLDSQAAMLLHEYLRRIQARFGLSNFRLQHTVRKVILERADWTFADELRYQWLACRRLYDGAFGRKQDKGAPAPAPVKPVSAEEAVREGFYGRILMKNRVEWEASTRGKRFGEPPRRKPHPDHPDILGSCLESVPGDEF